ncbi:MAG: hypothetical protein ACJ76H_13375 [Bacteriovoracaceae bacterium]
MALRFFLIFILSLNVFADDCDPVNLITETNSPFQKIPVYNQGALNICYAYSAAQILDWYQMKNGATKRTVHPAWAALQYALKRNKDKLEIGHPKEAMESVRTSFNCDYDAVESALKELSPTESNVLVAIERGTFRSPASHTPVEILRQALEKNCSPDKRTFVMVPEVERLNYRTLNDDEAYEKFLSTKFSSAPSPVSIAYCANVWKTPEFDGIDVNVMGQRDVVKKGCEYHESLIVGQKMLGNSCHFLVRNTWGDRWTSYNKNYSCVCRDNTTGAFVDDCRPETHRNDRYSVEGCWLRSSDLARNIGQLTYVK